MTYTDAFKKAVNERDPKLAGEISERLRARGLNYDGIYNAVNSYAPIDRPDWDSLLYESESQKGES